MKSTVIPICHISEILICNHVKQMWLLWQALMTVPMFFVDIVKLLRSAQSSSANVHSSLSMLSTTLNGPLWF